MSDNAPRSYPSPTSAQVQNGVPFYGQGASVANDVPLMSQLISEELNRHTAQNNIGHENASLHQELAASLQGSALHQQLAQDVMGHLGGQEDYEDDDDGDFSEGGTNRKRKRQKMDGESGRQKNTRACDECRRKKVKCESEDGIELGMDACLACKKSSLQCQFSRIPQKRGPSKGYISKLDERLANVESAIRDYIPQAAHRIGLSAPEDPADMYSPSRGAVAQRQNRQLAQHNSAFAGFATNGSAGSPWDTASHDSAPPIASMAPPSQTFIDESVLTECRSIMQDVMPILPGDTNLLGSLLSRIPEDARRSFVEAVKGFVRANTPDQPPLTMDSWRSTVMLFVSSENDFAAPSTARSLVSVMTSTLLALSGDSLGPLQDSGSARAWLSHAVSIVKRLRFNVYPNAKKLNEGNTFDTESKLARRLYVVLFILDQWSALGEAALPGITSDELTLMPEDQKLLGSQCYTLAKLTFVLAHAGEVLRDIHNVPARDGGDEAALVQRLKKRCLRLYQAEVDRAKEDVFATIAMSPLLQAVLEHMQLVALRLQGPKPGDDEVGVFVAEMLRHAAVSVELLPGLRAARVPFVPQHTAALAVVTIAEAVSRSGDGAARQVAIVNGVFGEAGEGTWDRAFGAFVAGVVASAGQGEGEAAMGFAGGDVDTALRLLAATGKKQSPTQVMLALAKEAWSSARVLELGYMNLVVGKMPQ